jgi:hypothetical protein
LRERRAGDRASAAPADGAALSNVAERGSRSLAASVRSRLHALYTDAQALARTVASCELVPQYSAAMIAAGPSGRNDRAGLARDAAGAAAARLGLAQRPGACRPVSQRARLTAAAAQPRDRPPAAVAARGQLDRGSAGSTPSHPASALTSTLGARALVGDSASPAQARASRSR